MQQGQQCGRRRRRSGKVAKSAKNAARPTTPVKISVRTALLGFASPWRSSLSSVPSTARSRFNGTMQVIHCVPTPLRKPVFRFRVFLLFSREANPGKQKTPPGFPGRRFQFANRETALGGGRRGGSGGGGLLGLLDEGLH